MAETVPYEPTDAETKVLEEATEEAMAGAGAMGGRIGGAIGGALGGALGGGASGGAGGALGGRFGGASGGAKGGRRGARVLKPQTAEARVEAPVDTAVARARANEAIAERGKVIEDPNGARDGSVWGIVGSGVRGMSPALVRVAFEPEGPGTAWAHIRAIGKEGLFKQRVGVKAADRIAKAVSMPSA